MRTKTINKLCCPFDKSDLKLTIIRHEMGGNILDGILSCKSCDRVYPIVKGIPVMSPDEYREQKLEQPLLDSWKIHLRGKSVENFRLVESRETTKLNPLTKEKSSE
jgi:uncharacterized protein